MRILVLLHDAFGGRGGIAKFNRDLLTALASHPRVADVVALPRVIVEAIGPLPDKLDYRAYAAGGKAAFLAAELAALATPRWFDLVICGHLRLLPLVQLLELRGRAPLGLVLHGVDAWEPYGGAAVRRGLTRLDWFLAVSEVTKQRFLGWSRVAPQRGIVIPNAVDLAHFTPGPKSPALLARYGLAGKRVLMGMARLDNRERYKGFDEVMAALPALLRAHPDLAYMICGDGSDRARLEAKARDLGIADRVVFTGYVDEAEKVDHYRLADCFLLAGWGEGFGIVLIEAMACGVPAIGSRLDASCEAVGNGTLGIVVDPKDPDDLRRGITAALARPRDVVPPGLDTFSYRSFERRVHERILAPLMEQAA
ncbi:MAG: glycosyltransferase family 4 protein [Proteobacteria bacterium]|nr:glycosyltransferase family 4 protein [Pseudomonadota bacterium]